MPRFREEVINVQLAELLTSYGLEANPETLTSGQLPDVLINMGGVKVVLEGRRGNKDALIRDTQRRVEDGIADIGLAIFYTQDLNEAASLPDLRTRLAAATFQGAILRIQSSGVVEEAFGPAGITDLVEVLNGVFRLFVKNDVLRKHVDRVHEAIDKAVQDASDSGLFFESKEVLDRLKHALGIEESI